MTLPLFILAEAEEELAAAAEWYEAHRPGLGAELIASIDETLDQVCDRPLSFPVWTPAPTGETRE